jgi:hypothetical protein
VSISSVPAFSEIDTFRNPKGEILYNRNDYFLVKGKVDNKSALHRCIDSFTKKNVGKYCDKYTNYLMFFYRESDMVNEQHVKETEKTYRYKLFQYTWDEDYIGSFGCWNSLPASKVHFQPKYE